MFFKIIFSSLNHVICNNSHFGYLNLTTFTPSLPGKHKQHRDCLFRRAHKDLSCQSLEKRHYGSRLSSLGLTHLTIPITEHQHNLEQFQKKIADKTGADFVLIEENSISEENFVDNAHLNVAGQQEKAYVILKSIERIVASIKL